MRAAVVLRDLEGLSTQEAAESLGVVENTLKSRLHRARLQLAERIRPGREKPNRGRSARMVPSMCCS